MPKKPSSTSGPKKSTATPPSAKLAPGKTSLGDFRERFMARAAELAARPDVCVLWNHVGEPTSTENVERAAEALRMTFSPAEIELYTRSNGLALVWASVHANQYDPKVHKPKKGMPPLHALESLDTKAFRMIVMPPIEKVAEPLLNYADNDSGRKTPRYGFDFPGNFIAPSLVAKKGKARVLVGDDYGADWEDSLVTSLEDYVETVLATWGDVGWRRAIYIDQDHGVGRAYFEEHPVTIESLLPPPPSPNLKHEQALTRTLRGTYDLTDELLTQSIDALQTTNEDLLVMLMARLGDCASRERLAPHLPAVLAALDKHGRAGAVRWAAPLADLVDKINAPLAPRDAEVVLKYGDNSWWARARAVRGTGAALLEPIGALLDPSKGDTTEWMSGIGAAALLGTAAASLAPRLEAFLKIDETHLSINVESAAATALVAVDHGRATEFASALLASLEDSFVTNVLREEDETPALAPLYVGLPEALQRQVAQKILETDQSAPEKPRLFELLISLGRIGIDSAFAFLEEHASIDSEQENARIWQDKAYLLSCVLPRCELTTEERTRVIAISQREVVAAHARDGFWFPNYLASLLVLGGRDAIPKAVAAKVLSGLDPADLRDEWARLGREFARLKSEGVAP